MDRREVSAELFRRTRIAVDPEDPAFLIVEINKIALESQGNDVAGRISKVADGFEKITKRNADEFIEVINRTSSVLMTQINGLEAAAAKLSVPEYLGKKYPESAIQEQPKQDDFKSQFMLWVKVASIFSFGMFTGFFMAGFSWLFFR